jgi:hypothetical protein
MKINSIMQRAASYKPPLPLPILYAVCIAAGLVSAYGSGYFFYWIYTIDSPVRYDFDVLNPSWLLGMLVGVLISFDIYATNYKYGAEKAVFKLFGEVKKPENINDILHKFIGVIKPLRVAARYTTIIGFSCLMFGKIDIFFQQNFIADDQITILKKQLESIEAVPVVPFEETAQFKLYSSGLNDGILKNDSFYIAELARARAEYAAGIAARQEQVDRLKNEIFNAQNKTVKVNNIAFFDFFAEWYKIPNTLLVILSIIIAGYVVDNVFGFIAAEIGEYTTHSSVMDSFIVKVDEIGNDSGNDQATGNGSKIPEFLAGNNGGEGEIGNGYGIDFNSPKNQLILNALRTKYGRITKTGERVSLSDIASDPMINVSRQYVSKVKAAAIEAGILKNTFFDKLT